MKIIKDNVEQPIPEVLTQGPSWSRKERLARYITVITPGDYRNALYFLNRGQSYSVGFGGHFWRFEP